MADLPQFSTFHISDPNKTQTFRGRPSKGCNKCRSRKVKVDHLSYCGTPKISCKAFTNGHGSVTKYNPIVEDAKKVAFLASIETNSICFSGTKLTKRQRPPRRSGGVDPRSRLQKASQKLAVTLLRAPVQIQHEKRAWSLAYPELC